MTKSRLAELELIYTDAFVESTAYMHPSVCYDKVRSELSELIIQYRMEICLLLSAVNKHDAFAFEMLAVSREALRGVK